jgi:hemerythrin-like domain-containing protein
MNFNNFKTYGDRPQNAFETFCTQLFERYLRRKYGSDIVKFRVVNGAGGDGGIEAYGELSDGDLIAVQAKWFRTSMQRSQIKQIEKSVKTAIMHRLNIVEYIICVPRALASVKTGKGDVPVGNTEVYRVDQLTTNIETAYPNTTFTWWFEQDMQNELLEGDNEGMIKFWFERDVITHNQLVQQFELEKAAWIDRRYIPELHGQGMIQSQIEQVLYSQPYRKELLNRIGKTTKLLQNATSLISRFSGTLNAANSILPELKSIQTNIDYNLAALLPIITAIQEGVSELPPVTLLAMTVSSDLFIALKEWQPSAIQLGLPRRLSESLDRVVELHLNRIVDQIKSEMEQTGRLFLGNSGTGKTHAVANTVDIRLNMQKVPALIIRAKGAPAEDWTTLLKKAMDIDNWSKNEILSALETLAIRADYQAAKALNPGDELKNESTKVIICLDGLEEDTKHWPEWYERIRESIALNQRYSRVRFAFTARPYFLNEAEMPTTDNFRVIEIPREGDIPVQEVVDRYFEHFAITVEPKSLIRGIDTLYALRLFCKLYEGQKLTAEDEILTAEHDLLNEKINRMEDEFEQVKNPGAARTPVRDSIGAIAEIFYAHAEIAHPLLYMLLKDGSLNYLDNADVEKVIEFLVNNAFMTKSEIPIGKGAMRKIQISYTLTFQSIMEIIMAEKYVDGIVKKEITVIPEHLRVVSERGEPSEPQLVNQRIVQEIVNTLFHDHNLLIGRDDFLAEGFSTATIKHLQNKALIQAPPDVAASFKDNIDGLYFKDHKSRHFVFGTLIYPSAASAANYFGAEYLHGLLMQQTTAVDRDKIWLGMDRHDIHELNEGESLQYYRYDLRRVIDPVGEGDLYLPELSLHNEYPLVFGWALATLDQSFRERLRTSLTGWAIKQPQEFKILLVKLFPCNDPQIQEDLAAITLGVASKLKDKAALQELAEWSLANVFAQPGRHPDIIVRIGFRSVVEKAFYAGVIGDEQAAQARPRHVESLQFIPVDADALEKGGEEIYPIVHDLAWYVIKRSFDDFLEYQSLNKEKEPEDKVEEFLKAYIDHLGLEDLSVYEWAISAAIAYMKSLGFNRTEDNGNSYTDSSHGSKSKLFTQEEKYTWLAVHYIQGYLSDYLPHKDTKEFVDDYMKIVNVDNPAEFLTDTIHEEMPDIEDNWIVKEPLAPEMQELGTPDEQVKVAVESEPVIDFNNWIHFNDKDLRSDGSDKEWLALFNYTKVHDSKSYIYSSVDIRGVLIEKGQALALLDMVKNHPRRSYFVESIDRMVSSPDTDTYSNPTDVVWMKWIGENYDTETYYLPPDGEEKVMHYAVTSVTKDTVEYGEGEIFIPSKIVRDMLGITEMAQQLFLDDWGRIMSINHVLSSPNYDKQEMTLVPKKEFLAKLGADGKEIVWFVDLYRTKNALNERIKSDEHPMKTRKYMVWYENGELHWEKFWDARFSNQRDKDSNQQEVNGDD